MTIHTARDRAEELLSTLQQRAKVWLETELGRADSVRASVRKQVGALNQRLSELKDRAKPQPPSGE